MKMSAIEYGSYYWGVVLHAEGQQGIGQTVHLHADQMKIDPAGALVFTSAGRRVAGAAATHDAGADKKDTKAPAAHDEKDSEDAKKGDEEKSGGAELIYVAFAPGTWKTVYAAKLQDGQPASIEHWTSFDGKDQIAETVGANAGAAAVPR
jgi:hypothetical protein